MSNSRRRQKRKYFLINKARKVDRIIRRNRARKHSNLKTGYRYPSSLHSSDYNEFITLPRDFSILHNTNETLGCFEKIRNFIGSGLRVTFDMSNVSKLSPEALLYMLSIFEYFKKKNRFLDVRGNTPINPTCAQLLLESGFFKYVRAKNVNAPSMNILSIEDSHNVRPQIAKQVVDFTRRHLNQQRSRQSRRTYEILIECMGNTFDHAYSETSLVPKWYLMALNNPENENVHFTFLDGGRGIPKTISKNFKDHIATLLQRLGVKNVNDSYLIQSALNGEFRTRTKEGYRGKGLPKIYQCVQNKEIENLIIISNRGYVNCSTGETRILPNWFYGTMLTWDFKK